MMRRLHWLLPSRISGQIAIVIAVSLVVIHSILTFGFFSGDHHGKDPRGPPGPFRDLIRLIDGFDPQDRPRLLSGIGRVFPQYEFALVPAREASLARSADADPDLAGSGPGSDAVERAEGGQIDEAASGRVTIRLADGQGLEARIAPPPGPPPGKSGPRGAPIAPLKVSLLSLAIIMTLLGVWVARVLTAPLRSFVDAAEAFNPDAEIAPLPEGGPEEIRAAARALNRMCSRIKSLVDDRMRTLAAVGHDLRTPSRDCACAASLSTTRRCAGRCSMISRR